MNVYILLVIFEFICTMLAKRVLIDTDIVNLNPSWINSYNVLFPWDMY
jgi:hypothetical protein